MLQYARLAQCHARCRGPTYGLKGFVPECTRLRYGNCSDSTSGCPVTCATSCTAEARKLEYDCPNPNQRKTQHHPKSSHIHILTWSLLWSFFTFQRELIVIKGLKAAKGQQVQQKHASGLLLCFLVIEEGATHIVFDVGIVTLCLSR